MAALSRNVVVRSKSNNIFKTFSNGTYTRMSRLLATSKAEAANSQAPSEQGLNLSDQCIKRLKEISDGQNHLRVSVEGGGCSGFQYKFDMDSSMSQEDKVFEKDGVRVIIDTESLEYLKGSTVDFSQELIRSTFVIAGNPQAEHGCSCGASFTVKL